MNRHAELVSASTNRSRNKFGMTKDGDYMKLNKLLLTAGVLALCAAPAMAQDFGDFGDFDDSSSDGVSSKVEVSGNVSMEVRAFVDTDDSDKAEDEKIEVVDLTPTREVLPQDMSSAVFPKSVFPLLLDHFHKHIKLDFT